MAWTSAAAAAYYAIVAAGNADIAAAAAGGDPLVPPRSCAAEVSEAFDAIAQAVGDGLHTARRDALTRAALALAEARTATRADGTTYNTRAGEPERIAAEVAGAMTRAGV